MAFLKRSEQLYERALCLLPGGVNSPVRAFGHVGGTPRFVQNAEGARLTDVDGNEFVDFVNGWGALPLGHAHPAVVAAITEAAARGTLYGAPHEGEIRLAETITARMPWVEVLRCVNSGTEAVMSALRLGRAYTARPLLLKFEGGYHGHADSLLSGIDVLEAPYNDVEAADRIFAEYGPRIAAVIVEPVAGNMGVVPPLPGFLKGLREITERYGTLLIFDEVITGFRVGLSGAAGLYGVEPDLTCFGKILGGGLPMGAFGGKREVMQMIAPSGPVFQAGTFSGNPLAVAAGLATLSLLNKAAYERWEQLGALLEGALHNDSVQVNRVGSMLSVFFTRHPVTDFQSATQTDQAAFAQVFHTLLDQGFYLPPSPLEAWFISLAHNEEDLRRLGDAFHTVVADRQKVKL